MENQTSPVSSHSLQFDRVVADDSIGAALRDQVAARCVVCGTAIDTEYYQINDKVVCDRCRAAVEASAETPRGVAPFVRAGLFGLGAGLAGAIVYYGVIAILNLEIGIVAILIGYMVGYAVRKGAGGRGGRRFQVLAVALTYASIALAYTPMVFTQPSEPDKQVTQNAPAAQADGRPISALPATPAPERSPIVVLGLLLAFVAALPMIVVFGSLPSGLISAAIIFFGMSQAWRMTGVPKLKILGPYRVGTAAASASA
jgi:predicted lipid-binding transport protein (Tim44 family)